MVAPSKLFLRGKRPQLPFWKTCRFGQWMCELATWYLTQSRPPRSYHGEKQCTNPQAKVWLSVYDTHYLMWEENWENEVERTGKTGIRNAEFLLLFWSNIFCSTSGVTEHIFNFFLLYCPIGISPMGKSGCFPRRKPDATESRHPYYGAYWVF